MPKRIPTLVVLLAAYATPSAYAAVTPTTYFFYALVTNSTAGSMPLPGSVVPISVTVDTSFPADTQLDHVTLYSGGGLSRYPSPVLAALINGQDVLGVSQYVSITQNLNGLYQIEIQSFADQSGGTLDLILKTGLKGIVRSDDIPKRVFPGNFKSATFSTSHSGVGYSGRIID